MVASGGGEFGFRTRATHLLQLQDSTALNNHLNLVARFHSKRFASLARQYDLVSRRKSCFFDHHTFNHRQSDKKDETRGPIERSLP